MTTCSLGNGWALEWASAGRGLEEESGDLEVVITTDEGGLIALLDGLGHGPEAAFASQVIAEEMRRGVGTPLEHLVRSCHERARPTRGAVLTVANFISKNATLAWCAIGNVEAWLFRAHTERSPQRDSVTLRGGVVGYQIPSLRARTLFIDDGDLLVMATDGIKSGFEANIVRTDEPSAIVHAVMTEYERGTDDALVLAARFLRSKETP